MSMNVTPPPVLMVTVRMDKIATSAHAQMDSQEVCAKQVRNRGEKILNQTANHTLTYDVKK